LIFRFDSSEGFVRKNAFSAIFFLPLKRQTPYGIIALLSAVFKMQMRSWAFLWNQL
jgi:hypothetical protein